MKLRRLGPLAGLLAVAIASLVALHHLGGAVPGPPSWAGGDVLAWASDTDPVLVALAVVRLVALAFGYQLMASAGLATMGSLVHAPALLRASDLVALPGVRGLVRHAAAATLSASTLLASPALPSPAGTATLRVIPAGPTATLVVDQPDPGSRVTLSVEPAPDAASPLSPRPSGNPTPEPTTAVAPAMPPSVAADAAGAAPVVSTWTVARGDHLWSIAERTLTGAWGRPPTEREIDRYWRTVVAANGEMADPDLIFVGQQVALPPVPAP